MRFLLLHALGDGDAGVPVLLAEAEVVGVDELVDFLLDGAGRQGDVVLGEKLLLLVVVELVVADGTDFGLLALLRRQQPRQLLLLHTTHPTSFFSRFSYASFTNIAVLLLLYIFHPRSSTPNII